MDQACPSSCRQGNSARAARIAKDGCDPWPQGVLWRADELPRRSSLPTNFHMLHTRDPLLRFPGRLLLLWSLLCSGCVQAPSSPYPLATEIQEAAHQLEERFAAGDLLGVADSYRSDAVLLGPSGYRIEGREAIDTYWSRLVEPVEWKLNTHSIEGGADLAYQRGTSFLTSRWDGDLNTSEVEFLLVWVRGQEGAWKIALDSNWNAPSPAP